MSGNFNIVYNGKYSKFLPDNGHRNEVILTKKGKLYIRNCDEWKAIDTAPTFYFYDNEK